MVLGYRSPATFALAALVTSLAFAACGGDAFRNNGNAAGGADNAGRGSAVSGAGAGEQPLDPPGGAGGAREPAGGGAGAAGDDDGVRPCAELGQVSALAFGPSEPLELVNQTADTENLRFPRVVRGGPGLTYTRDFFAAHVWITDDPSQSPGAPVSAPVSGEGLFESGALLPASPPAGALESYGMFFQRTVRVESQQLELLGAKLSASGNILTVERLPAPFNPPTATVSWGYGLALGQSRAIWTINENGVLDVSLRTAALAPDAEAARLELQLPNGCVVKEIDFAPWLTPDARTLFFSSRRRDATSCELLPGDQTALFAVQLAADGQPLGPARELDGLHGTAQTDASLSPDRCWLYYAASTPEQPHLRLFRAPLAQAG
jgi:hypothetical protein